MILTLLIGPLEGVRPARHEARPPEQPDQHQRQEQRQGGHLVRAQGAQLLQVQTLDIHLPSPYRLTLYLFASSSCTPDLFSGSLASLPVLLQINDVC